MIKHFVSQKHVHEIKTDIDAHFISKEVLQ